MTKVNDLIKLEVGFMEDGDREVVTYENVTAVYKEVSNSDFNDMMIVIEYIQLNDEAGSTHYWIDELNYIKDADTDYYYYSKTAEDREC